MNPHKRLINETIEEDSKLDNTNAIMDMTREGVLNPNKTVVENDSESTEDSHKTKVYHEIVDEFQFKFLLIFLLIIFFTFIPECIVLMHKTDYKIIFQKTWWVFIPCVGLFLFTIIYTFINRVKLINNTSRSTYILFPLYLLATLGIFTILSFYSVQLALGYSSLISLGIVILYILNSFTCLYNRVWIKLTTIYLFIFLYLIFYIIVMKKHFVEFFMLTIISVFYFGYLVTQLKDLLCIYSQEYNYNISRVSVRVYLATLLITNVDLFMFSFR